MSAIFPLVGKGLLLGVVALGAAVLKGYVDLSPIDPPVSAELRVVDREGPKFTAVVIGTCVLRCACCHTSMHGRCFSN